MSYVEKKDEKTNQSLTNIDKKERMLSVIFSDDTIVESPEDIIEKDTDEERKNLFKKTYEALIAMFPENSAKKKRKNKKEQEKFQEQLLVKEKINNKTISQKTTQKEEMERE